MKKAFKPVKPQTLHSDIRIKVKYSDLPKSFTAQLIPDARIPAHAFRG